MSNIEVMWAWVAGLLEGEGCFDRNVNNNPDQTKVFPRIRMQMTDVDVLERCRDFIEGQGGRVSLAPVKRYQDHHKQAYELRITNKPTALLVCSNILPFLGERRRAKIAEIMP